MKTLLKFILTGVALGIVVLMLSYLGVYYIEGQEIYEQEILQLTQGEVLQNQLAVVAFYGGILATAIYAMGQAHGSEEKTAYKQIGACILFVVVEIIMIFSIDYIDKFSPNIETMIAISDVLIIGGYILAKCAIIFAEEFIINKKIKEKNAQDTEKGNQ